MTAIEKNIPLEFMVQFSPKHKALFLMGLYASLTLFHQHIFIVVYEVQ